MVPILLFLIFLQIIFSNTVSGVEQYYSERPQYSISRTKSTVEAKLTIDVSSDRKQISKYIYGVNIANWCQWYYLNTCAQKLKDAKVTVIRLGATNMERYNYTNNRMYNVATGENQYVPMSWGSFVNWCREDVEAVPFLMVPVYGHVAGEGSTIEDTDFDLTQTTDEVTEWIYNAGKKVKFWGIGNEPWIAWKRSDYPDIFGDAQHGDVILNKDTLYDTYFNRFLTLAHAIKKSNPTASVLGPASANWYLYWTNDYSPYCPVTEVNGDAQPDHEGWQKMLDIENQWNQEVFPDRGDDPDITGWETDMNRNLSQYLIRAKEYEDTQSIRVADYMDVHRYLRTQTDYDAIQETRGLWQDAFQSQDLEVNGNIGTSSSKTETKVLKRFQNMVDAYYPGTELSFSEYDYFYWNGHPELPQVAAVGQMDFLGFFARMGVKLACNWYVGEPDQSGGSHDKGKDSAGQAIFNEKGEPNPKYWAFWLMSRYFRGESASAKSSDWSKFSVHACMKKKDIILFIANKGDYDADTGSFIPDQSAKKAQIVVKGLQKKPRKKLQIKKILRFGMNDPYVIQMEKTGIKIDNGTFTYEFQPLSIYVFVLSSKGLWKEPKTYLHVNPKRIDFGPHETGSIEKNGKKQYIIPVKITNARHGTTNWSITEQASWLDIVGDTSGKSKATDTVYLTIDRTGLSTGDYETMVTVKTSEGTVKIPVTMEVVSGEAAGIKRICDFDTGSLAHTWNKVEPYSVGLWDGHGTPEDRDNPYIYNFSLDQEEKPALGGLASLKVVFDRSNGDTDNGKGYMAFGTYGHKTVTTNNDDQSEVVYDATANWTGYKYFQFDIKTDTKNNNITKLQIVVSDESGNSGKPSTGINSYDEQMELTDGDWQTVTIPLDSDFYDWRYPEGQNGSLAQLDFSKISQIEFVPWSGSKDATGVMYLDNLLLTKEKP